MRIAVTGAAGDVGGYVARELSTHGHEVVGVDVREPVGLSLSDMRKANIENLADLTSAFEGCSAVVHLAAIREPGIAPDDVVFRVNTMGTYNALEAAVANGVRRLVLASSEAVLGVSFSHRNLAPVSAPIDETHPLLPEDCYALSKLAGEELCRGFTRRGVLSTVCLRTCYVWSLAWRDDAIDSITNPSRGGRGLWAYVHAEDAARAYRLACEATNIEHESLFISAADTRSLTPTETLLETHFPTTSISRPMNGFESVVSSKRAGQLLGFSASRTWRDELTEDDLGLSRSADDERA